MNLANTDKRLNFHYETTKDWDSFYSHKMKFHNNSFQNRWNKSEENNIQQNRSKQIIIEIVKRKLNSWLSVGTNRVSLFTVCKNVLLEIPNV